MIFHELFGEIPPDLQFWCTWGQRGSELIRFEVKKSKVGVMNCQLRRLHQWRPSSFI